MCLHAHNLIVLRNMISELIQGPNNRCKEFCGLFKENWMEFGDCMWK